MADSDGMAERYFEPEDVDALISTLTRVMGDIMRANEQATAIAARLEAERERIGAAGGGVIDRAAWKADTERLSQLAETVKAGLAEIGGMGGTIKDLSLGLVDFPHRRDGRVVNLCWKYGENAVTHWHGLDEGYANRKPLRPGRGKP
jgi:hypothetical protein